MKNIYEYHITLLYHITMIKSNAHVSNNYGTYTFIIWINHQKIYDMHKTQKSIISLEKMKWIIITMIHDIDATIFNYFAFQ